MREPFLTWNAAIAPQDAAAAARAKARWDGVAKPLNGLGKLETAVIRIAGCTGDENVSLENRTVLVLCVCLPLFQAVLSLTAALSGG